LRRATDSTAAKVRGGRWAALVLVLLIPGLTIGLYQFVGTQEIIALLAEGDVTPVRTSTGSEHSLEVLVERLAERMRQEPDNAENAAALR
jgi:cytochrome c-type biogenesis protein CcmH/NrfG